jgi:hypothetical protein
LRKGDFTRTAAFGAKRTFNKNRCSRQVSFVRIWKLEVAPDYRRVSGLLTADAIGRFVQFFQTLLAPLAR